MSKIFKNCVNFKYVNSFCMYEIKYIEMIIGRKKGLSKIMETKLKQ